MAQPHAWEQEEVDGGPAGTDLFWKCSGCGASGGIVGSDDAPPTTAFLADGGGLYVDRDDCPRAAGQIAIYEDLVESRDKLAERLQENNDLLNAMRAAVNPLLDELARRRVDRELFVRHWERVALLFGRSDVPAPPGIGVEEGCLETHVDVDQVRKFVAEEQAELVMLRSRVARLRGVAKAAQAVDDAHREAFSAHGKLNDELARLLEDDLS